MCRSKRKDIVYSNLQKTKKLIFSYFLKYIDNVSLNNKKHKFSFTYSRIFLRVQWFFYFSYLFCGFYVFI